MTLWVKNDVIIDVLQLRSYTSSQMTSWKLLLNWDLRLLGSQNQSNCDIFNDVMRLALMLIIRLMTILYVIALGPSCLNQSNNAIRLRRIASFSAYMWKCYLLNKILSCLFIVFSDCCTEIRTRRHIYYYDIYIGFLFIYCDFFIERVY